MLEQKFQDICIFESFNELLKVCEICQYTLGFRIVNNLQTLLILRKLQPSSGALKVVKTYFVIALIFKYKQKEHSQWNNLPEPNVPYTNIKMNTRAFCATSIFKIIPFLRDRISSKGRLSQILSAKNVIKQRDKSPLVLYPSTAINTSQPTPGSGLQARREKRPYLILNAPYFGYLYQLT